MDGSGQRRKYRRPPKKMKKRFQQHSPPRLSRTTTHKKMSHEINVFTDGSALFNVRSKIGGIGGVGVYFENLPARFHVSEPFLCAPVTNIRAEIYACIRAIEQVLIWIEEQMKGGEVQMKWKVHIYTDSEFFINVMTKWIEGWKRKDWKKADGKDVLNVDLIYWYDALLKIHRDKIMVEYHHVKAHQKEPKDKSSEMYRLWQGNHRADQMARNASMHQFKMMGGSLPVDMPKEKEKEKEEVEDEKEEVEDEKEEEMKEKTYQKKGNYTFTSSRITDFWNQEGEIVQDVKKKK